MDTVHPIRLSTETTIGGSTVAQWASAIAASLAAIADARTDVLLNLGANDVAALPAEATWKANLGTILDAIHTKWPNTQVYIMQPWRRGYASQCNSLATWIGDVVATKAWSHVGPDERVFLENGDDGVTYTSDGIHPNAAGYVLTATQWKATLGY
jgi:lysophospholipase L1-like esterase